MRLVDRKERQRSVDQLTVPLRERLARIPGITVTNIGVTDLGGGKSLQFSIQGTDLASSSGSRSDHGQARDDPRTGRSRQHAEARQADRRDRGGAMRRPTPASTSTQLANALRTLVAGTTVGNWRAPDGENYDVNVRLTPDSRNAIERPAAHADQRRRGGRRLAARRAACRRWPT